MAQTSAGRRGGPPRRALLHACAPAPFGGLERVVAALTSGLAERGHVVTLAAVLDADAPLPGAVAAAAAHGVRIVEIRLPARAYAAERRAIRDLAHELGADVVHTHGYRSDVVAGPAARAVGAARVTTSHGIVGGGWKNRVYEWLQRRAYRGCDAVVAVSEELARSLARRGVRRLHVIPNGDPLAEPAEPAAEARRALGVPAGVFHIGWVGRLSPEKGPDVFMRALSSLDLDGSWRASMLGTGPLRQELVDAAARAGFGGRVGFPGRVDHAARLFGAFDVLVLSSRREGTPVSLLEAVAAGVPLVATRVGGVEDVVGAEGALLVEPEDPEALAAAIRDVRDHPDAAARRATRARERRATADDWIAAYEDVYEAALAAVAGGARP